MPRALDLGLGSKIQAQIMPRMILSTVAWDRLEEIDQGTADLGTASPDNSTRSTLEEVGGYLVAS